MIKMYSLSNCQISIFRGTVTDEFGDVTADDTTPIATNVVAYVAETAAGPSDLASQTPRVVRSGEGSVSSSQDVQTRDRIVITAPASRVGEQWVVRDVVIAGGVGQTPDLRLNLTRVTD